MQKGSDIHAQEIFLADTNFFSVFSFPLIAGDVGTVADHEGAIGFVFGTNDGGLGIFEALPNALLECLLGFVVNNECHAYLSSS